MGATVDLRAYVSKFFKKHLNFGDQILLAFSGGVDSLALYHLMLQLKIPFSVAHVDHGWRKESSEQAKVLAEWVKVPFYTTRLIPPEKNKEDAARRERYRFFKELTAQEGYAAVVLGHHGDDQAETVLKRLFEGAGLSKLGAMSQVSQNQGMALWRPLLGIRKSELVRYCNIQNLEPIIDETNVDPRYLRARMRRELIPSLTSQFGKDVVAALQFLGEESREMTSLLTELAHSIKRVEGSQSEQYVIPEGTHRSVIKFFLRGHLKSRDQVELAAELIDRGVGKKQVGPLMIRKRMIEVSRAAE